jgi:ParB family transcriptional regulator, chromosome partitioning protein
VKYRLNKKFGLGKGLGALIPEESLEEKNSNKENGINVISINLIKANIDQPRKNFDEEKIIQLSESIKEHGIIQPIILKKEGETYNIVAGERRWRAAKIAGIKEIPAIIMDLSDKEILEISLIENIQRQDLNPIEESIAYKKLIDEFNLTQEQLSNRIGKSRTSITNCLRLLNLDKRVQEYLIDGVITEGHGRAILSIEDKELQYKLAQSIIDEGLSVRETEKLIKNIITEKKSLQPETKAKNPYYIDIKDKLENLFGTKVLLMDKKNKGKIEIEYYSKEDLQRILDILNI